MSAIPYSEDVLDRSVPVLQLVDVAKQLGLVITRVHQLLRDRQLLAIKRDGVLAVPAAFFDDDGRILAGIPGLIAVLHDGGFRDDEILNWMFREDDTLTGGSPAAAMHTHARREVMRRAQALGF
ncbi:MULTISPECIES: Rv2175c family DNA-binding protein [Rhodococcus]|uniref:Rv2175c family DNA-binding protein n=1 Tax=Rhodococcus indonesiensis TaxID=3055869 RepID=A0ABT7RUR1_9NOCA|nr:MULTISPECIES: Rv2175c family DNA-binding protein [Rhodococcus]MDM7490721.1 Rv2175c family DNA-binding protein [Rhodococcus indonesiensis]